MSTLAPLPVAVPLGGAAALLCLNTVLSRRAVQAASAATVLAEVGLAAALLHQTSSGTVVYWFGGWIPRGGVALGISFTVDQLGAGGAVLVGLISAAALATVHRTMDDAGAVVHSLLLVLLAAMAGFCLTGDLFNLFVFFELMAVSAFALAAHDTRSPGALGSALNFAITNTVGAFLVLIGIAMLYSRTGALNLAQIGRQLAAGGPADRLVVVALSVLLAGFLIKAAVVPFHFWLIDTASAGPVPLAVVLAGALDTLGVYAIARIYWTVFAVPVAGHHRAVQAVLIGIGALSAAAGGGLAVTLRQPRRRLAFVMVAHTGILLIGIGCLTARGVAGSAVYAVGDGVVKASLWAGLALLGLSRPADDERPRPDLSRAERRAGLTLLTVGALATAGPPLFATGLGKSAIEDAAAGAGYPWVVPVVVLTAVLTAAAMLHLAWTGAGEAPGSSDPAAGHRQGSWLAVSGTGAALLGISVGAAAMGRWAATAGARFVDTAGYQRRVLDGMAAHPTAALPALHLSARGALLDLLTVGAAITLTAASSRDAVRRVYRRLRTSTVHLGVVRLHDGNAGDSATWVTVGTATIALVLALSMR